MEIKTTLVPLFLALAGCAAIHPDLPINPLSVEAPVAGATQAELSEQWWQWAGSFDGDDSPVADLTGRQCANGQRGEIWFLAGTYGSSPAHRICHLPAGKYLFFPLINYIVMPCSNCERLTCPDAEATARAMTDHAMGLFAELDGRSFAGLDGHRVASPRCFNVAARVAGAPDISPSASNGYWLLLPPLQKGTHRLHFGGSLPSLRQELDYTLVVE